MSNTHQPDAGKTQDRKQRQRDHDDDTIANPGEGGIEGRRADLEQHDQNRTGGKPRGAARGADGEELDQPIGDPASPDGDDDNGSEENGKPGNKPGDVQNDEFDEEIGKPESQRR